MGSISVAVVRGFELPKQGRQMILPVEGAEKQRLNLARSMLLATSIVIGARIGRVALPFSAIDHSRPVERDACGLVGSKVGRKKLLPLHIRGTGRGLDAGAGGPGRWRRLACLLAGDV